MNSKAETIFLCCARSRLLQYFRVHTHGSKGLGLTNSSIIGRRLIRKSRHLARRRDDSEIKNYRKKKEKSMSELWKNEHWQMFLIVGQKFLAPVWLSSFAQVFRSAFHLRFRQFSLTTWEQAWRVMPKGSTKAQGKILLWVTSLLENSIHKAWTLYLIHSSLHLAFRSAP